MNKSPRACLHPIDIERLQSDNFSSGDFWILVSDQEVTIARMKPGQAAIGMLSIPRGHFAALLDWFEKEQELQ